jgi:hypothetical protein
MFERREAAQRGVLEAILSLYDDGILTAVLDEFYRSVLPAHFALLMPVPEDSPLNESPDIPSLGSYTRSSRIRERQNREFEAALGAWACKFRLTGDLTETGECLPWVLEFGRRACQGRQFSIPPVSPSRGSSTTPIKGPPPWGWQPSNPDTDREGVAAWLDRIRPELKERYYARRREQRSRAYPDPEKRNPNHYRWFVLHVCGGMRPGQIAEALALNAQEDAVRKGIKSVHRALGLNRK